ncbi:hypothetical protein [Actinomadura luteofluorescens]|uniref:hypothetical protein n=1 Tax=Actinomadura luteofluorescens TaxID=46163 RepID=UPI003D8AAEF0
MDSAKLPREDIAHLLRDLCIDLGFCLPPQEQAALCDSPPADVDAFTKAVFRAEGLDPSPHASLYAQVRKMVAKTFPNDPDT